MWFLYALFLIELLMPPIRSKRLFHALCLTAISAKVLFFFVEHSAPAPVKYLCSNLIWFVLGAAWAYNRIHLNKIHSYAIALSFVVLSIAEFALQADNALLSTLLTLLGIIGCVESIRSLTRTKQVMPIIWAVLSKYMFQIYLLHTIFAAGIRIVLLKLGCTSLPIHILSGLFFSFVIPIVCAASAERIKPFNIVFFPSKTIKGLVGTK